MYGTKVVELSAKSTRRPGVFVGPRRNFYRAGRMWITCYDIISTPWKFKVGPAGFADNIKRSSSLSNSLVDFEMH